MTLMINSWLRLWGEATLTRPPQPMPTLGLSGAWLCGLSLVPQGSGLARLRSSHPCQVSILGTTICYLGLVAFKIVHISIFLAPNLCERMEKKFHPLTPYWRQIGVRGWKKKSILSLLLAPNLCERMKKKFHPLIWQLRMLPILILVLPSYLSDHHILAKCHCWEHSLLLLVL